MRASAVYQRPRTGAALGNVATVAIIYTRPELLRTPVVSNAANRTQQKSANAPKTLVTSQSKTVTARVIQPVGKAAPKPPLLQNFRAPATNAWSRTPARAVSEPAKAIRAPPASAKQGIPAGPLLAKTYPHHHVDADGQKPEFAQLAADLGKQERGRPPNGHPTPSRSVRT
ncbi:hypothetical protein EVAR_77027_1 [Eumeta japonica]|uniref:Uncharacterized protein n=1 Tax=Eumeta variegata TaxID=151549 RepID=A0A4C1T2Z4_EUMVA|nr:hypothetical protein EVAR_77027_1 [Eumeta japonica]